MQTFLYSKTFKAGFIFCVGKAYLHFFVNYYNIKVHLVEDWRNNVIQTDEKKREEMMRFHRREYRTYTMLFMW